MFLYFSFTGLGVVVVGGGAGPASKKVAWFCLEFGLATLKLLVKLDTWRPSTGAVPAASLLSIICPTEPSGLFESTSIGKTSNPTSIGPPREEIE